MKIMPDGVANKIISKHFPLTKHTLKELTDHGNAFVFLVTLSDSKKVILRIAERKESLENNFLALKYLKGKSDEPLPLALSKMGKMFYSIESYIEGKKHNVSSRELKGLIKTLRKTIHSKQSKKCGYLNNPKKNWKTYFLNMHVDNYRERFFNKIKDGKKYLQYIHSNFPNQPRYLSLLHGDFSFTNSLFHKNKWKFFDFEDSFFGEKEYDLGMIYYMEFLPEKDVIDSLEYLDYDRKKILFYALCIGIRKVALARGKKYIQRRIKKMIMVYERLIDGI